MHTTCTLTIPQAYFNDEEHEIRAILCRGEDRLILAFRGTARVENLLTDLKFHQVKESCFVGCACGAFLNEPRVFWRSAGQLVFGRELYSGKK